MLTLTTAQLAALNARPIAMSYFVTLALSSGTVAVWNGIGALTAGGVTYSGIGELGFIDGIEADRALKAGAISVALVGIPSTAVSPGVVANTRAIRYQGAPLTVAMGLMNPDTGALIDGLIPIWQGFADTMTMALGATVSASLTAERYDSIMRRANGNRMTTYSHNQRLGNPATQDLFFEAQDRMMGVARPPLQ